MRSPPSANCHFPRASFWFINLVFFATFVLATTGCSAQNKPMAPGGAPPPPPRNTPAASAETAAQLARLRTLAASSLPEDQIELARLLGQTEVLDQLDEPKVRDKAGAMDLRIAGIITQMRTNPAAAKTLASLGRSEPFNESWQRQELLVRALASQRPPLPDALAFLEAQSRPDSVNLHIAIEALVDNGSEPAIALLGRKLADPSLDSVYKIGWMRGPVLTHRRDPNLLRAAENWLATGGLDEELRNALAEALFDYRPHEWYPGREGLPRPPVESTIRPESSALVRRIGQLIQSGVYPEPIKTAVRHVLTSLPR
jgi:hypothetical protein